MLVPPKRKLLSWSTLNFKRFKESRLELFDLFCFKSRDLMSMANKFDLVFKSFWLYSYIYVVNLRDLCDFETSKTKLSEFDISRLPRCR